MPTLEELRVEARRIHDQSLVAAERHFAAETPWYRLNYALGIPSVVLAAVAGATGLSQLTDGIVAGVISLVVAALTALLTFLDPLKNADTFHRFAKDYEKLYHETGFFCRVQSRDPDADPAKLRDVIEAFVGTFNALNRDSPAIALHAQRRAGRNLEKRTGEVVLDPDECDE